ncbi:MAG: lysoplasmalogenase [Lysobacterales bacterium]
MAETRSGLWLIAVALAAALAISSQMLGWPWAHYLSKPLATLLLAAMVWTTVSQEPAYRRWVLIGLLWSALGDAFLMLPGDWFVYGLLSFLAAHLAYLWAFRQRAPWLARLLPFALYGLIAAGVLSALWPGVPPALRVPVIVYVAALAAMAAQAAAIAMVRRDRASVLAAVGGASFLLSDALLAWNRFAGPIEAARLWVLSSYWLAQWLIARSVARR